MALEMYSQNYDGFLPPWLNRRHDGSGTASKWDNPENLYRSLQSRIKNDAVLLAAVPATIAVWWVASASTDLLGGSYFRDASLGATVLIFLWTLATWRKYVRWSVLRTTGLTLLALAHVLLWYPVWAVTGCAQADKLCTAQSSCVAGIWLAGCVLAWWARVVIRGSAPLSEEPRSWRYRMSPSIARLVVGMALIPFLPGLWCFAYMTEEYFRGTTDSWTEWRALELCAVVLVGVWLLLWQRRVEWNARRRACTVVLALLTLASPAAWFIPDGNTVVGARLAGIWDAVRDMLPFFAASLWLAGTAWTWRSIRMHVHAHLQAAAINMEQLLVCPQCGYSLIGLRDVRCPECGWSTTVDDIVSRSLSEVLEVA